MAKDKDKKEKPVTATAEAPKTTVTEADGKSKVQAPPVRNVLNPLGVKKLVKVKNVSKVAITAYVSGQPFLIKPEGVLEMDRTVAIKFFNGKCYAILES